MQARGRFQQWRSRMSRTFPPNLARLMLLMCAALWGGSFVVAKFAMQTVPPQWLTGSRMAGACLLMWPLFRKSIMRSMHRDFIIPSLVVGITYYVAMLCQLCAHPACRLGCQQTLPWDDQHYCGGHMLDRRRIRGSQTRITLARTVIR